MEAIKKPISKDNLNNNKFCQIYKSEAIINIKLVFLDLLFNLKPNTFDYFAYEIYIYDINNTDSDEPDLKVLESYKINSNTSTYKIKIKKNIHDPCCFYQYYNIKLLFKNSKEQKKDATYMIPLYYNKTNVVFSLFYNIGIMSFEIIMRKDTFIKNDWIREPLLDFKNGNNCLEIESQEKFEENACLKRFLFININTYRCFPNLNLGKYIIFKYTFTTDKPSHFTVYLDENFEHIGFFKFKVDSLKEKTIDFDKLNILYEKCKKFKEYIDEIKNIYKKVNYLFEIKVYKNMILILEDLDDISLDEIDNLNLFLRQNIKILEVKGKELIFYFSYVNLFLQFKNKQLRKYFVHIIILFETFQNYLRNIISDEFDRLKLFTISIWASNIYKFYYLY